MRIGSLFFEKMPNTTKPVESESGEDNKQANVDTKNVRESSSTENADHAVPFGQYNGDTFTDNRNGCTLLQNTVLCAH